MKKSLFAVGVLAIVMLLAGCRSTRVAEVNRSQEEIVLEQLIRVNYPNYRPPRSAAPAVYDNTEERVSSIAKPAEKNESAPEVEAVEVAAPAEKADAVVAEPVAPEVKADAAATEKTAEVKADAAAAEKAPAVTPPVAPPDPTNSTVYVVQSGDTLGKISQKHYGSARHSNVIFKANGDILKDPDKLRPGMKLIVPKL